MWMGQQEQVYLASQHPQQQTLHPGIIGTDERTHHHHRSVTMDLPGPSNPRASRNMAEKQRRDNLNTNISAMAALVPIVAESPRKMDKISVLRLAAAFIRVQYTLGRGADNFLPRELGELDLERFIVDNLIGNGGFFIVVTSTGQIVYVSQQVQEHLGHTPADLLGNSLYTYAHPKDHEELTRCLTPDEMQGMVSSSTPQITDGTNENSNSSEDSSSLNNERKPFREQRRNFELRMLHRTTSRREHTQYECFDVSGILRLADACKSSDPNASRANHREVSSTSNDIIFVGVARLLRKRSITGISIIDANRDEYITRHLVDGRIIYCDHRVSVVAGYLSEEVSGLCAFSFMHKDDFRWTLIALRQMYDRGETCGSSCYRLLSKTGEFIYLRTHGYLELDEDTQTVVSFVCINTLVSEEEGIQLVKQMKKRFSATMSDTTRAMIQNTDETSFDTGSDSQQSNSKSSVEDPTQLEDAITHLVSDLSSSVSEDQLSASPVPNEQYVKAAMVSQHLPPAAAQASKIGIKKIDHYLVVQGKGSRTPKQESKTGNDKQTYLSERQDSSTPSLVIHDITNENPEAHEDQDHGSTGQLGVAANHSPMDPCMSDPGTSHLDVPQSMEVLSSSGTVKESMENASPRSNSCDIKVEDANDVFMHQQEPMMEYLENSVPSETKSSYQYSLKRIYSDEDIRTSCNKKIHGNVHYGSTDQSDEQQRVSYGDCRPFVNDDEFPELSTDFSRYNNLNSQLKVAESPNSSLNEVIVDYQHVDSSMPLMPPNPDNDEFIDLHGFKDDTLLSLGLDANPDVLMKLFDDLRHVPIFENTFNDVKVQQLTGNNAMDNEIKRKHQQLINSMALQESQLNVLARDLENPALQAKRGCLTPLQAEHNMQKQMLETLQQEHHNIQINMKHNIGV